MIIYYYCTMRVVPLGVKNLESFVPGVKDSSLNLVYGPPGVGKTILAIQFLAAGARKGENVIYISLDQAAIQVKRDFENMDIFLDEIYVFDAVPITSGKAEVKPVREVTPFSKPTRMKELTEKRKMFEADVLSLKATLKNVFDRMKYDRVVVDSITALRYFYMRGLDPDSGVHSFLQFLMNNANSAILVTAEEYDDLLVEKSVMDSVFHLERQNDTVYLTVEKGTFNCTLESVPVVLTKNGFAVDEKFYLKFVRRRNR